MGAAPRTLPKSEHNQYKTGHTPYLNQTKTGHIVPEDRRDAVDGVRVRTD
jgi:hypothetical protein